MQQTLDPDLLRRVGESLYGPQWQTPLARALGLDPRIVRFWAAGERQPPSDIPKALDRIIKRRIAKISALVGELEKISNARKKAVDG